MLGRTDAIAAEWYLEAPAADSRMVPQEDEPPDRLHEYRDRQV